MDARYQSLKLDFVRKHDECKGFLELLQKRKVKCDALETANQQLADQNRLLGVRAAVSFDDLTPRYKDLDLAFSQLQLERPPTDFKALGKVSSIAYIQALLTHLKSFRSPSNSLKGNETASQAAGK